MNDDFATEKPEKERKELFKLIENHALNKMLKSYEHQELFLKATKPEDATTLSEIVEFAQSGKCEIEGRILACNPIKKESGYKNLDTKAFIEAYTKPNTQFKEACDYFAFDNYDSGTGLVGTETIPLLGGPFYKSQLYQEYIRGANAAFSASTHDPMAHHAIRMMVDFTLGRGYKIRCEDEKKLKLVKVCESANKLAEQMEYLARELSINGETMIWKLPDNQSRVVWQLKPEDIPHGLIPRIRLIDPTTCFEVITYPEDITRVVAYQLIYATSVNQWTAGGQPSMKFIVTQVPASEVIHTKINAVSNEKRGRSDLFSCLGYFKRLHDAVNYKIIGELKNNAWSIDTTVKGSSDDLRAYIQARQAEGTIPPPGSENVHSEAIESKYLANQGSGSTSDTFEWVLSMIAAGTGFPIHYFNTHLAGHSSKAGAVVASEPIARMVEARQNVYARILKELCVYFCESFGVDASTDDFEIIFPEIISQDKSQKIKDLTLVMGEKAISHETYSNIVASELEIQNYNYGDEMKQVATNTMDIPLSSPLLAPSTAAPSVPSPQVNSQPDSSQGLDSTARVKVKDENGR